MKLEVIKQENYVLNGEVGSNKTNKSFRPNKKIVKKTNSNKDKKGRACFHCGKKVLASRF